MDIKCLYTTPRTSEFALYQSTKVKEIYSINTKTTANDFFPINLFTVTVSLVVDSIIELLWYSIKLSTMCYT